MGLAREILEDLPTQRLQSNVEKALKEQQNTGTVQGCISGDKVKIADNTWRVYHGLGVEPKGFIIIDQGSTSSIKATMTNMTVETVEMKFDSDPTSFTLFLY